MTDIARERRLLHGQGLDISTRESWEAVQDYDSDRDVDEPAKWFFLHISVTIDGGNTGLTEADDMRDIERIGQQRFGVGFPYNASAFDTGRLYEGQPLTRRGAHTVNDKNVPGFPKSLNYAGRALVLPQMVTDDVTDAQIDAAARWAAAQKRAGLARRDAPWYGHRDFAAKDCPGAAGYAVLPEIRQLTEHYTVLGLIPPPTPKGTSSDMHDTCAHPTSDRIDAVSVGEDGGVWHTWAETPAGLQHAAWENLGGGAKGVSCLWTSTGTEFVVTIHGLRDDMWQRRYSVAEARWTDWYESPVGTRLLPPALNV